MSLAFAAGLAACELAAGPFPPEAHRCDWCGADLPKRRRRWCSDACSNAFSTNHAWTNARAATIARDRVCRSCGSPGPTLTEAVYRLVLWLCPRPRPPRLTDWCREHGWYPDHIDAHEAWRHAVRRQMAPWEEAMKLYLRARRRGQLEVNHITPCLGKHAESSCAHHLENLEVLCHRCHVKETARQRRAGLLERTASAA